MKVDYFYDEQFRRVLKHLIRIFGEFQVQNGVDDDNNVKYRKVPCLYADLSRQSQYTIAGSENILNSAPFMTISVKSLNMNRKDIRAPVTQDVIMGVNRQNDDGAYTKELDSLHHIQRFNPVPWTFEFDLNIWTTTLTNKMELIEQIACIFNPSIQLQLSTNPLDWTSLSNVELLSCEYSTRSVPQGQDSDLDIAKLSFTTEIYFSLPAIDQRAVLIQQIVTNISTVSDEQDILFNLNDGLITDVFTPQNFSIKVDKISESNYLESYELTLLNSEGGETTNNGKNYDWNKYLTYLEPDVQGKQVSIKFQTGIEDSSPVRGTVMSIGSGTTSNKIVVQVDTSNYTIEYTISKFIWDESELLNVPNGTIFVYMGTEYITKGSVLIKPNDIIKNNNSTWEVLELSSLNNTIYNAADQTFYKFNETFEWHRVILSKYRPGYWRIAFMDK